MLPASDWSVTALRPLQLARLTNLTSLRIHWYPTSRNQVRWPNLLASTGSEGFRGVQRGSEGFRG
eukprot:1004672-Pyramimonas_sp.AAC.1